MKQTGQYIDSNVKSPLIPLGQRGKRDTDVKSSIHSPLQKSPLYPPLKKGGRGDLKTKGLIQLYTGEGKGKTTAGAGLACRARGHNLKVCYIYFHKDPDRFGYGELNSLKKLGVNVRGFAQKHPHFYKKINVEDVRKECLKGMEFVKGIFAENKYDVLILDEILISLRDGFLQEKEILEILDAKPEHLEIILTGRGATPKIMEQADLISEIKKIKHPFDCGVKGRKGIEY